MAPSRKVPNFREGKRKDSQVEELHLNLRRWVLERDARGYRHWREVLKEKSRWHLPERFRTFGKVKGRIR